MNLRDVSVRVVGLGGSALQVLEDNYTSVLLGIIGISGSSILSGFSSPDGECKVYL